MQPNCSSIIICCSHASCCSHYSLNYAGMQDQKGSCEMLVPREYITNVSARVVREMATLGTVRNAVMDEQGRQRWHPHAIAFDTAVFTTVAALVTTPWGTVAEVLGGDIGMKRILAFHNCFVVTTHSLTRPGRIF